MKRPQRSNRNRPQGLGFSATSAGSGSRATMAAASVPEQERRALEHLQQGNHAEAEHLLRALLAGGKARASTALNLAGLCTRDGRWQEALNLLETALRLDPAYAAAHFNIGHVRRARGDLQAAAAAYQRALELKGDLPGLVPCFAQTLCELGDLEAAATLLSSALQARPQDPELHYLQANTLARQGDPAAAMEAYQRALALRPAFPEALCNLGSACEELGQTDAAISAYRQALDLLPSLTDARFNLANLVLAQGNLPESIQHYQAVLAQNPEHCQAWCNLGNALRQQDDLPGAAAAYRQALTINADFAEVHCNLGTTLQKMGNLPAASSAIRTALALKPHYPEALSNLGDLLEEQGEPAAALDALREAISQKGDYADAHFNLGLTLLGNGDYAQGWEEYEWRWCRKESQHGRFPSDRPLWTPGRAGRVLLWGEQGIGDEVMFASQIPQLHALCDALTVRTDERLLRLFQRSFSPDITFQGKHEPIDEAQHEHHIPMGSVGRFLRRKPMAFQASAAGYLQADEARVKPLREILLEGSSRRLIGVSWSSTVKRSPARDKTLPLNLLAGTLRSLDARLISLQYGHTEVERRQAHDEHGLVLATAAGIDLFNDLDGLVALIQACDSVVTISNVTAHLAGALGKPTTLLLPYSCDWRWGRQENTTVWYSSVTILRQQSPGDWTYPLEELSRGLA